MDIKLGSDLFARDGRCGTIRHVVVDPGSRTVRAIVVAASEGDVVVPIEQVEEKANRLLVNATRADVASLPRFMAVDFCLPPEEDRSQCHQIWPVVPATLEGEASAQPLRVEHVAMAPGDLAVDKGTPIRCRDGDCGSLEEVLADPDSERISAVLVRRGLLFTGSLLIPASWIDHVGEGAIHLRATRDQVDKLALSIERGEWGPPQTGKPHGPGTTRVYPDIEPGGDLD